MKGIHNSHTCTCQMCEFANEQERRQLTEEAICDDVDQVLSDMKLSDRVRSDKLRQLLKRVAAFNDDPGHSDLDDEQPIRVQIQLGDVHFARGVLSYRDRIPELTLRLPVEASDNPFPVETWEHRLDIPCVSPMCRNRNHHLVLRLPSEAPEGTNPYQTTDPRVKMPQNATLLQSRAVRQTVLDVLDEKLWRLHETQWYVFPGTLVEAEEKANAERLDFVDEVISKLCQT